MLKLEVFSTVKETRDKSNVLNEEKSVNDNDMCAEDKNNVFGFQWEIDVDCLWLASYIL